MSSFCSFCVLISVSMSRLFVCLSICLCLCLTLGIYVLSLWLFVRLCFFLREYLCLYVLSLFLSLCLSVSMPCPCVYVLSQCLSRVWGLFPCERLCTYLCVRLSVHASSLVCLCVCWCLCPSPRVVSLNVPFPWCGCGLEQYEQETNDLRSQQQRVLLETMLISKRSIRNSSCRNCSTSQTLSAAAHDCVLSPDAGSLHTQLSPGTAAREPACGQDDAVWRNVPVSYSGADYRCKPELQRPLCHSAAQAKGEAGGAG